jgi:hypothetical protein
MWLDWKIQSYHERFYSTRHIYDRGQTGQTYTLGSQDFGCCRPRRKKARKTRRDKRRDSTQLHAQTCFNPNPSPNPNPNSEPASHEPSREIDADDKTAHNMTRQGKRQDTANVNQDTSQDRTRYLFTRQDKTRRQDNHIARQPQDKTKARGRTRTRTSRGRGQGQAQGQKQGQGQVQGKKTY